MSDYIKINDFNTWVNTTGKWVEEYVIPPDYAPKNLEGARHFAFLAEARWSRPTCLRYFNPQLLKDGRTIAATVEQEGVPGEPGWVWRFYVGERIVGPVEWRVETRSSCPAS